MIHIVDNTLRDGSYVVDFNFTEAQTRAVCKGLDELGFSWLEVGHGLGLGAWNKKEFGLAKVNDIDSIVAELPVEKQTQAKRILHKVAPIVMSWNDRLEITVYGKHFPQSNIIDILQYLLRVPGADIPPLGEAAFREAIQNTGGIPLSGIRKTKSQQGKGTKRKLVGDWISY